MYGPAATEVLRTQRALNEAKAREAESLARVEAAQSRVADAQRRVRDIQADINRLVEDSIFARQAEEARRQGLGLDRTLAARRLELALQLQGNQISRETFNERISEARDLQFAEREIIGARTALGRVDEQQIRDGQAGRLEGAQAAQSEAERALEAQRSLHSEAREATALAAQANKDAFAEIERQLGLRQIELGVQQTLHGEARDAHEIALDEYEDAFAEVERQVGLRQSELDLIDLQLLAVKARDAAGIDGLNKQLSIAQSITRELDRANSLRAATPSPVGFTGNPSPADQARLTAAALGGNQTIVVQTMLDGRQVAETVTTNQQQTLNRGDDLGLN